ncbi:hypothetical protein [Ramlibacter sp. AN1133]|uniref:hypothetical protein n=1 Tax=Ramlibacter sp. AN1133 TaxID=3133429 RepID=UPI0030BC7264
MAQARWVAMLSGLALLLLAGVPSSVTFAADPRNEVLAPHSPWSQPYGAANDPGEPPPVPQATDLPGFASPAYLAGPRYVLTEHAVWELGTGALKNLEGRGISRIVKGTRGFGVVAGTLIFVTEKAIEAGEIAVPREDAFFTEQLLLAGADAGRLRGLRAQGVDLRTDPEALAIHHRALGRQRQLEARSLDGTEALWGAVANHGKFVLTKMAINTAGSWALGKALQRAGLEELASEPGDALHRLLRNKGPLKSLLKPAGWNRFDMRANWAREYANKVSEGALGEMPKRVLSALLDDFLDRGWQGEEQQILLRNPPSLRVFAARAAVPVPVAAVPVAPVPVAVAARAIATPVRTVDPLVQAVATDDFIVHLSAGSRSDSGDADRAQAAQESRKAVEDAKTAANDAAWRARMREQLRTIGDGKTFSNCSGATWDGQRGKNLCN